MGRSDRPGPPARDAHIMGRAVMFPILPGAALRFAALPRPYALSAPPLRFLRRAHNTRRYGHLYLWRPWLIGPARSGLSPSGSLLQPPAGQQVQPPNDCQDPYYRGHCDDPEEHTASMHSPLSLAVGYKEIVTHSRHACNCVVAAPTSY